MGEAIPNVVKMAAISKYPQEACGVIVAGVKKAVWIECKNISDTPEQTFRIDPYQYSELADQGEILGIWHTHPNLTTKASDADRASCEASQLPWYIISVNKDSDDVFTLDGPAVIQPCGFEMPYLERPYVFGVFDCYSLCQDYYKREYGITLENIRPRITDWWKKGHNIFEEAYAEAGFARLIDQEPQEGDLFLIQTDGAFANHVAVYIGNEMIMHHCHGRLSKRDVYGGGYWQKHTTFHLRHKDMV